MKYTSAQAPDYSQTQMTQRCELLARYLLEKNATVRQAAGVFGISKSTVHKDVTSVLRRENPALWQQVKELLEKNKQERHFRGGEATKRKYRLLRESAGIRKD